MINEMWVSFARANSMRSAGDMAAIFFFESLAFIRFSTHGSDP